MEIEQLEQIAAVIVTAGLVAGNFLMFTPWRNGEDPRQRQPESLMHIETSDLLLYFYFVFVLVFKAEFVALVLVVLVVASQVVQNRPFGKGQAFWVFL